MRKACSCTYMLPHMPHQKHNMWYVKHKTLNGVLSQLFLIRSFSTLLMISCYKMITFQNVSSEAKVKIFFILQKSYVLFSRYSFFCIFNHPMIYQICDIMISNWNRVHFLNISFELQLISHQIWQIDRYKQKQYFSEIFWKIWRTGAKF